jgi:hypothetical protein
MKTDMTTHTYEDNHRTLAKLVEREVIHRASELVSRLAELEPDNEEVMNLMRGVPDYETAVLESNADWIETAAYFDVDHEALTPENARTALLQAVEDEDVTFEEIADYLRVDPHEREIFEHWIVSDFFAEKLSEHGETTGELYGLTIWGRPTTGQSISLDHVVLEIAAEMEILKGQKYEWKD